MMPCSIHFVCSYSSSIESSTFGKYLFILLYNLALSKTILMGLMLGAMAAAVIAM